MAQRKKRASPGRTGGDGSPSEGRGAGRDGFFTAAIGASAGGLEALEELFGSLPADPGIAFVVITHMHREHASLLPALLQRHTKLPVQPITDGTRVEPDRIFVIQPDQLVRVEDGTLRVSPREPSAGPLLIDRFLRSLAQDAGPRAIAVILSGTGSDGTVGVGEVRAAGGFTLAQTPESARFDGMPRAAIAGGSVDAVAEARQMADLLVHHTRLAADGRDGSEQKPLGDLDLSRILQLLRKRSGRDFSGYKATTVQRRVERRLAVHQLRTGADYIRLLEDEPAEIELLFKDLLIGVTSFFRDADAFESLFERALLPAFQSLNDDHAFRAWVPGCSTGEEAYSIAMLLHEAAARQGKPVGIQVFATDLDEAAIASARAGLFGEGIATDVGAERLERFFVREDDHYRVRKELRESVVFAPHDLLADPPFLQLDLVSCRNLLIYLDAELQRRVLPLLHYALRPGGTLFLGASESVAGHTDLFVAIDRKWRIFSKQEAASGTGLPLPDLRRGPLERVPLTGSTTGADTRRSATTRSLEAALLQSVAPASAIVNERGEILYVHGRTGQFLEPAQGRAAMNIFEMARPGLAAELRNVIRHASLAADDAAASGIRVGADGGALTVDLRVKYIREPDSVRGLMVVSFEPRPVEIEEAGTPVDGTPGESQLRRELEVELHRAHESLQGTIQDLQRANEELESANEELQSTNEELETSKEEAQSLHEELQSVNTELHTKVDSLSEANDDLQNLMNATDIGTLFVDEELRIKRFTRAATQLVHLIASDVGRPLEDLQTTLDYPQLASDCREVLETLVPVDREMPGRDERWYQLRIAPYRTSSSSIRGLVITFIDVTERRKAQDVVDEVSSFAGAIVDGLREAIAILDDNLRVVAANARFHAKFGTDRDSTLGRRIYEVAGRQWDLLPLRRLLEEIVLADRNFDDFDAEFRLPDGQTRRLLLNARRLRQPGGGADLILLAFEEPSERRPESGG